MTVEVQTSYVIYHGNGATTVFPYAFMIPSEDDVTVFLTEVATEAVTVLNSAQYTITGTGMEDESGGEVTYPLSGTPLPVGYTITIQRSVPYTQPYQFNNQDRLWAENIENALDWLELQIQQLGSDASIAAIEALIQEFIVQYGGQVVFGAEVMSSRAALALVADPFPVSILAVLVLGYSAANVGPMMKFNKLSGAPSPITEAHVETVAGEWFELDMPIITVDMCGGDPDDAAVAAFNLGRPLQFDSPLYDFAELAIDPVADDLTNTDVGRNAVMQNAINWAGTCITGNNTVIKILVNGAGPINTYGQLLFEDYGVSFPATNPIRFSMKTPSFPVFPTAGYAAITAIEFETTVIGGVVTSTPAYGGMVCASLVANPVGGTTSGT